MTAGVAYETAGEAYEIAGAAANVVGAEMLEYDTAGAAE